MSEMVGYSEKINSPEFEQHRRVMKKGSYRFAFVITAIAIIGFPLYGEITGELELVSSLLLGLSIGGLLLLITVVQTMRQAADETWDGLVTNKRTHNKTRYTDEDDPGSRYVEYSVEVQRNNGKVYRHTLTDPMLYNYYSIGDKVRHHNGLFYYEKHDKSTDDSILCVGCGAMSDIDRDQCGRCKCPLLK